MSVKRLLPGKQRLQSFPRVLQMALKLSNAPKRLLSTSIMMHRNLRPSLVLPYWKRLKNVKIWICPLWLQMLGTGTAACVLLNRVTHWSLPRFFLTAGIAKTRIRNHMLVSAHCAWWDSHACVWMTLISSEAYWFALLVSSHSMIHVLVMRRPWPNSVLRIIWGRLLHLNQLSSNNESQATVMFSCGFSPYLWGNWMTKIGVQNLWKSRALPLPCLRKFLHLEWWNWPQPHHNSLLMLLVRGDAQEQCWLMTNSPYKLAATGVWQRSNLRLCALRCPAGI